MLTIHAATSAAAVKRYFEMADYYSEGQETVGRWGGKLAARLGLSGTVDQASFESLCDNLNPFTGESLTLRTNGFRRVGYDFVFSGPKSFSIVEAFASEADRRALLAAFDEAVNETMAEDVEPDMQVRIRKGGVQEDRVTGNMLTAAFDHSTARPVPGFAPDMQRHRHVFAFNATHDPVEDEIKAGQFAGIKRDGEFYTAAFYSRLALKLEALGYRIDRRGGKAWEIAGLPHALLEKFSKRTGQVEEAAERLGITDAEAKAGLGATTRSKKDSELSPAELRQAWEAQLTDEEREALARVYARTIAPGEKVTARDAVSFALAHLGEQRSVFAERELLGVALLHGLGQVSAEQIAAELPRHAVIAGVLGGRQMATTAALQDEERELVRFSGQGKGAVCPVGVAEGLSRTLEDGRALNDGQWAVAQGLLHSSHRVEIFEGPAGAGKSFSLKKYDEGVRLAGQAASYLATTAKAVDVLNADGFNCHTVARFLLDEKMQSAATGGRLVVDEASMLGHKDAVKLFRIAEQRHIKLLLVGDEMQHGSVARGALLRVLKEYAGIKPHRLSDIMRQTDRDYRAAAQLLSEGKTLDGFQALERKGYVREIGDDAERYRTMAADYVQTVSSGNTCLVISPTHAEAALITAEIRNQLRDIGELGAEERVFTRLVAVNATEAQRGLATTFRSGDVVQFHQNAAGGFAKGQRLTVADPAGVPRHLAESFSLYRPEAVSLSVGDKIRFTASVRAFRSDHRYKNGDTLTVAEFTPGGRIRLDDGRVIDAKGGQHYRPAFVETSFGAQGQTVDRVILGMADASLGAANQEQLYVSSTRARKSMSLYTDDKEAVKEAIQHSSKKHAALDLQAKAKPSRLHRDHLERQHRQREQQRHRPARQVTPPPPPLQPKQERNLGHGR